MKKLGIHSGPQFESYRVLRKIIFLTVPELYDSIKDNLTIRQNIHISANSPKMDKLSGNISANI